jgi:D-glycero-beta-D-manno-heptose 1-phosphate adenylyltransferase
MKKLDVIKAKILAGQEIQHAVSLWRFYGKKIVFTNGCFDILHLGHVEYLAKAADLGHVLIVGINSDNSVKKIKGSERPVNKEEQRLMLVASLHFVNAVVLFDEETPYELIKLIQPDILVKGKDYSEKDIVGADIVKANNGEVITIELTEGYSSSAIIEKLKKL